MENFNWTTDSYTKLERAYRESETGGVCTLIDLPVSANYELIYPSNCQNIQDAVLCP